MHQHLRQPPKWPQELWMLWNSCKLQLPFPFNLEDSFALELAWVSPFVADSGFSLVHCRQIPQGHLPKRCLLLIFFAKAPATAMVHGKSVCNAKGVGKMRPILQIGLWRDKPVVERVYIHYEAEEKKHGVLRRFCNKFLSFVYLPYTRVRKSKSCLLRWQKNRIT